MRKHFYLITEHEKEDRVGCISIYDTRMSQPLKNEEGRITVLDEDQRGFREVGKKVAMGYADFDDEEDYENRVDDVIREKLGEIDEKWLKKAGHDPEEVVA